jgi:hypothetical protein
MSVLATPEVAVPPDGDELHLWGEDPTLEERVASLWDRLLAGEPAPCPFCGGEMRPRWSAGAGVVGGRCADCGTELD